MMDHFHLFDICLLSTYYVLSARSLPLAEEVRLLFIRKYLKAYVLDTLHKGFKSSQQLYKKNFTNFNFIDEETRSQLAPGQKASKGQKQNLNPDLSDSKICFFH